MPSWSSLKQKGGSQGRGSQGGKAPYAFPPSSSLHLKDFKAPKVLLTAFCSQRPNWRGYFSYIFIGNFANNSGERPHLAALPWPQEDPTSVLWPKKPPKTPKITQPQSQLRAPHHQDWSALLEGEKPVLNLPSEANRGIFTQDSSWGNFAGTLLMWKRFYLLCSDKTGFGLQLKVHFSESFKGKE